MSSANKQIIIGRFGRPYGVKGWITVISFTDPVENILKYVSWQIKRKNSWEILALEEAKPHGKHIIAKIAGINSPEDVRAYTNLDIAIDREQLPETDENEPYWEDLGGLTVTNLDGTELGVVDHLFATPGANDVIVVKGEREHLIPYIKEVIKEINFDTGKIIVDWPEDF